MNDRKKVLLVGCGDIGAVLGEYLANNNFDVTGLRRTPVEDAPFKMLAVDLFAPDTLSQLDNDYDFIVYTATPSQMTAQAYEAIYVQGLQNLMAAIAPPKERLLLVSSSGVYHQSKGEWVDEQSATQPQRFTGEVLLRSEQLALETWPNTTVVRFSGIYGPGRFRLINKVQQGCRVTETPPKYTNRIHRDDCAGLLAFMIEQQLQGVALDSIYIGSDHDPATEAEVLDYIASLLGLPAPERETVGNEPVNQNKRCSNQKVLDLGYRFKFPTYKEGYRELVDSLPKS
ncbi:MAG: NAD(P)-dependent oxidoreductase [Gammaproteobacteria bacterium]|nr:MAG: NAD(P)-dependent oxidoreductase [Gammaproteobacteria bacterium]